MSQILRYVLTISQKAGLFILSSNLTSYLGWNHRFNRLIAKYHPNVWHLFECLKREEVAVRQQMAKILMGTQKKRNKATAMLQQRISCLQTHFNGKNSSLAELLEGYRYQLAQANNLVTQNFLIFLYFIISSLSILKIKY